MPEMGEISAGWGATINSGTCHKNIYMQLHIDLKVIFSYNGFQFLRFLQFVYIYLVPMLHNMKIVVFLCLFICLFVVKDDERPAD